MNPTLFRLLIINRRVNEEIKGQISRRFPDGFRLRRLKKVRLAIKDRIARGRWAPRKV